MAAAAWLAGRKAWIPWIGGAIIGWLLLTATPLLPNALLNSLEDRFEPIDLELISEVDQQVHIVVLGSGHGFDDRLPATSLLSVTAISRLSEGIRLYHHFPNSILVLSGFSSSDRTTQAEMLQKSAILLGVDENRTLTQTEPGNTREEAQIYAERFGGAGQKVILVTSASHMPRAEKLFRNAGIDVVPAPANYRLKGSWKKIRLGLPSLTHMTNFRIAMSEYAALARERWLR